MAADGSRMNEPKPRSRGVGHSYKFISIYIYQSCARQREQQQPHGENVFQLTRKYGADVNVKNGNQGSRFPCDRLGGDRLPAHFDRLKEIQPKTIPFLQCVRSSFFIQSESIIQ
jgi:hypothetical protein